MPHSASFVTPRARRIVEICARERADPVLDDDRLVLARLDLRRDVRARRHDNPAAHLRDHRERRVARADLGVAGAEPDDDMDDRHAGRPRRREGRGSIREDCGRLVAEPRQDLDLQVHQQ